MDRTVATTEESSRPGLRERKKAEKAHLIRAAARELFQTKGYEATTMREVAALADVGFGTVSAYATDKAGLLAMLFVDDLEDLPPLFSGPPASGNLLASLTQAFMPLYAFWARNPALSRIVLPQMEFYSSPNPYTDAILTRRRLLQADLAKWLGLWQQQGLIHAKADTPQLARTMFSIYRSALRDWITGDQLSLEAAYEELAYLLQIPVKYAESPRLS